MITDSFNMLDDHLTCQMITQLSASDYISELVPLPNTCFLIRKSLWKGTERSKSLKITFNSLFKGNWIPQPKVVSGMGLTIISLITLPYVLNPSSLLSLHLVSHEKHSPHLFNQEGYGFR